LWGEHGGARFNGADAPLFRRYAPYVGVAPYEGVWKVRINP
jgi:hypothetical protein